MGEKRVDWDTNFPMFTVTEVDEEKKTTGAFYTAKETNATVIDSFGPKDAMSGDIFAKFAEVRMGETVKGLGRRNSPSRIALRSPRPADLTRPLSTYPTPFLSPQYFHEPGDPLLSKREQLENAMYKDSFSDILSTTWERPGIKHVIVAYGTDIPTEVGYTYPKEKGKEGQGEMR